MFGDRVNSLDDNSDTELPAMIRQIIVPSNDIPNHRNYVSSGLEENKDFLDDRL